MSYAEQENRKHLSRRDRLWFGNRVAKAAVTKEEPRSSTPVVVVPITEATPKEEPPETRQTIRELRAQVAELTRKLRSFEDAAPMVIPHPAKPIIAATAAFYGLSLNDILSNRRYRAFARPRHVAMYLAKKLTLRSLPEIGRIMRRDHTAVLHGIRKIEAEIQKDQELAAEVMQIASKFEAAHG